MVPGKKNVGRVLFVIALSIEKLHSPLLYCSGGRDGFLNIRAHNTHTICTLEV